MRSLAGSEASAVAAASARRPNADSNHSPCCIFGREYVGKLHQADAFAVGLTGCFVRHLSPPSMVKILPDRRVFVNL